MIAFVVDVNVAIVANGESPQADEACELACIQALHKLKAGITVIDDEDLIMGEYRRNLAMSGRPGVGDEFMYWLYQNQFTKSVTERVVIKPDPTWGHEEFPHDASLGRITDPQRFDPSDRKYVAVALASANHPAILNAVDSDYLHFEKALQNAGVVVHQLCSSCLKES